MSPNSGRIAICGEILPHSLKHDLLFFDRIGIFDLELKVKELRKRRRDANAEGKALANDLEFLQGQDIVFSAPLPLFEEQLESNECEEEIAKFIDKMHSEPPIGCIRPTEYQLHDSLQLFFARLSARSWQHSEGLEFEFSALRSTPLPKEVQQLLGFQGPSANVIDVVLDNLPMPSELTPWERILDFKADTEAQGYLQGLKVWMGEIARQKLTANEARDKLDWLLFQHKQHMKAHKLSYRWGTLGGAFIAGAEILEDLAKIKLGKAAGAVVSIVDRRLELIEAELANPAKEISYIVKANEHFEG